MPKLIAKSGHYRASGSQMGDDPTNWEQKAFGWRTEESKGKPIAVFGREITPVERILQVRWPGGWYNWYRPIAVDVREGDEVRCLRIHHATRRATLIVVLSGLTIVTLISLWRRGISSRRRNRS